MAIVVTHNNYLLPKAQSTDRTANMEQQQQPELEQHELDGAS
jgi:hypothetical protein